MDSVGVGHHNVLWDGKNDDTVFVGMGNYSFEVWTSDTGNSAATWVQAWENPVYLLPGGGLSSRDIEVVKNPMSPDFGKLLITESSASYGYARMILANANGSMQTEYGRMLFPQGTSDFDPWFISVAKNGNQYVTNNAQQKIYVFRDTVLINTITDPAIPFPRGIVAMGSGDPTLLVATGRALVRRVPAGTVDTVYIDTTSTAYLRDVAVDDSGYVFLSYGATSTSYTKVLKMSKTFVALDTLTLPDYVTHVIVHSGVDPLSNADDSIYARARGTNGGVFSLNFENNAVISLETSFAAHIEKDEWNVTFMGDKGGAQLFPPRVFKDEADTMVNVAQDHNYWWARSRFFILFFQRLLKIVLPMSVKIKHKVFGFCLPILLKYFPLF